MGTEPPAEVGEGSGDRRECKADEGQSYQCDAHTQAWWRFHRCFEMVRHGLPPWKERTYGIRAHSALTQLDRQVCGPDEHAFPLPAAEVRAAIDVQDVARDRLGVGQVQNRIR